MQNFHVVWKPNPGGQERALTCPAFEALFHGPRGSGKSDVLLMDFASNVGKGYGADYRGLIVREATTELKDIIAKSMKYFPQLFPGAKFNGTTKVWTFPDGEYLWFNYAKMPSDYSQYHGAEFAFIGWEELTNHPTDEVYLMLMSCLRSSNKNIRLKYRANCNPGGVGAQWVKSRFIDTVPEGRIYQDEFGKTRAHVFLPTTENKVLLEATPDYQNTLKAMTEGNENLRKAWLYGSWDIFLGGFFSSVWEPKIHVLKSKEFGNPFAPAFKIPASWRVQRSFDWGSARPWCVTYGAFCSGEQPEGLDFDIPVGSVVIFDEIYGWTGKPNEGDGATSTEIAQRVLRRDKELERLHSTYNEFTESMKSIKVQPGPADNSIWNVIDGTSIGASMSKYGLYWQRSMKGHGSRKAGLATIRDMLLNAKKKDPEKPHLYFFQSAANHIRTIPIQQTSRFDPEDIDTDLEDHCIAEGELVFTNNGYVPIEKVTQGDVVLTRDGWRKVLVSQNTGVDKPVLKICTNEVTLYCTGNHKVWTENRGFVRADSLTTGDTLLWLKGLYLTGTPTEDTQTVKIQATDIISSAVQKKKPSTCTGKCGNHTSGIFQKGVIFIIKTAIRETIKLKILSVLAPRNIVSDTHFLKNDCNYRKSILTGLESLQKHGTHPKRAEQSTKKSVGFLTRITRPLRKSVNFAVNYFLPKKSEGKINSALTTASLQTEEPVELTTKSEFAPTAETSFLSTNTVKLNTVAAPVLSIVKDSRRCNVYDLTVEGTHEFFVNGLLVHNCIDALRYLVARKNSIMKRGGVRM